jgi:type II secretory pathway pseudopilin PulG
VVVAIIGILASVVLASLGSARRRATDASIKSIMSQMRTQIEIQALEGDDDYDDLCLDSTKTGQMFREAYALSTVVMGVPDEVNSCYDNQRTFYGPPGGTLASSAMVGPDANGTKWSMSIKLNGTAEWFCIDSNGTAKLTDTRTIRSSDKTC